MSKITTTPCLYTFPVARSRTRAIVILRLRVHVGVPFRACIIPTVVARRRWLMREKSTDSPPTSSHTWPLTSAVISGVELQRDARLLREPPCVLPFLFFEQAIESNFWSVKRWGVKATEVTRSRLFLGWSMGESNSCFESVAFLPRARWQGSKKEAVREKRLMRSSKCWKFSRARLGNEKFQRCDLSPVCVQWNGLTTRLAKR